jgi:hypothetical protein
MQQMHQTYQNHLAVVKSTEKGYQVTIYRQIEPAFYDFVEIMPKFYQSGQFALRAGNRRIDTLIEQAGRSAGAGGGGMHAD